MKKLTTILLICFLLQSCTHAGVDENYLHLINNSKNSIFLVISENDTIFNLEKFKLNERIKRGDHIEEVNLLNMGIFSEEIKPKSTVDEKGYNNWKYAINNKKVRLYIIKKDSVDKYGWEGIHARNLYNKKYTFDIDDLDSLNWTIEYNDN